MTFNSFELYFNRFMPSHFYKNADIIIWDLSHGFSPVLQRFAVNEMMINYKYKLSEVFWFFTLTL